MNKPPRRTIKTQQEIDDKLAKGDYDFSDTDYFIYPKKGVAIKSMIRLKKFDFSGATFSRIADFSETNFSLEANFFKTNFSEEVNFSAARINKGIKANQAVFEKTVSFNKAKILGECMFDQTIFKRLANFSEINKPETRPES